MGRALRALRAGVLGFHAVKTAGLLANAVVFPRLRCTSHAFAGGVAARPGPRRAGQPVSYAADLARPAGRRDPPARRRVDGRHQPIWPDASPGDDPRVRLLNGAPLPDGWLGKNWACHQLAEAASGRPAGLLRRRRELHPGAVAADRGARSAARRGRVLRLPPPAHPGLGERLLVPLIDEVLLAFLPYGLLGAPVPAAAAANGQLLAFRRAAYDAIGGHAGVARRRSSRTCAGLHGPPGRAPARPRPRGRPSSGAHVRRLRRGRPRLRQDHAGRARRLACCCWPRALAGHLAAYTLPWLLGRAATGAGGGRGWPGRRSGCSSTPRPVAAPTWEAVLVPVHPLAALPVYASRCAGGRVEGPGARMSRHVNRGAGR